MIRKVLPLALTAAPLLLVMGLGAHAQQPQGRQQSSEQQPPGQQPSGQQATGQQQSTSTCRFTSGPRSGSTVDFSATPGVAAVPVGSPCGDMTGSTGVAVTPQTGRAPGMGRFYRTPEAPVGLNQSGQPTQGYTLTCRFTSGPNAGSTHDFSGSLGATPIRIGKTCSDGTNKGVGVAVGNQGNQRNQGGQGPQGS